MSDEPDPSPDDARESDVTVEQEAAPEEISADGVARVAIAPDDNGETYTSYGFGIAVHKAETEAESLRQHADAVEEHVSPGPNDKGYISGPRSPRNAPTSVASEADSGPGSSAGSETEAGSENRLGLSDEQLYAVQMIVSGMLIGGGLVAMLL